MTHLKCEYACKIDKCIKNPHGSTMDKDDYNYPMGCGVLDEVLCHDTFHIIHENDVLQQGNKTVAL